MLKRIYQHIYLIGSVLFSVLGIFFFWRLTGDSPKAADIAGLVACCALFGFAAIAGLMEDLERKLEKWLEAKTGTGSGSVNAIEPYRQRSQREDLEQSLVHALAPGLAGSMTGMDIGKYVREAADAIMNSAQYQGACYAENVRAYAAKTRAYAAQVGDFSAKTARCTCGASDSCNNCPTAGTQSDQAAEAEIVAAGLTAPRVTADHIQALMDKLTWRYEHEAGSRHTFAHAFLDDFYIATGHNAPISRENFDAHLGIKYAKEQAEPKARDKLWELEGYALHSTLTKKST